MKDNLTKGNPMKDNRGLTLVELIVAMAIMAIAGIAVFGFMTYSSNNYARGNTDVKLQYDQQLAMNQVRDEILETSKGLHFDEAAATLTIYSEVANSGSTVYRVTKVTLDSATNKLYIGQKDFATVTDIDQAAVTADKLLAENVTKFSVDTSNIKKHKIGLSMSFKVKDKEQSSNIVIALRNDIIDSDEKSKLYTGASELKESFIKSITILRDGTAFTSHTDGVVDDTIGKCSGTVTVPYTAKVEVSSPSEREYTVDWRMSRSIDGISVSDGVVTVKDTVTVPASGKLTFDLTAYSVDDPTKYATITIEITDNGVYPKSASLSIVAENNEPGQRTYEFAAVISYTDGTTSSDPTLMTWPCEDITANGFTFNVSNPEKNNRPTIILLYSEETNTYTIYYNVNKRGSDGELIKSNEITISTKDIEKEKSKKQVAISGLYTADRNASYYASLWWKELGDESVTDYSYDWVVTPDNNDTAKDKEMLKYLTIDGGTKGTDSVSATTTARRLVMNWSGKLDWTKEYQYKITVTPKYKKNFLYVYETAAEYSVTIPKVSLTVWPIKEAYSGETVSDSNELYCEPYSYYAVRRWFSFDTTGFYMGETALDKNYSSSGIASFYANNGAYLFDRYSGLNPYWESGRFASDQCAGFIAPFYNVTNQWYKSWPRPTQMNFRGKISFDNNNYSVQSDIIEYSIDYDDDFYPW